MAFIFGQTMDHANHSQYSISRRPGDNTEPIFFLPNKHRCGQLNVSLNMFLCNQMGN